MNIQMKLITLLALRFARAFCGCTRFILAGLLIAGTTTPALAVDLASPATATQADCQQAQMTVNEGIKSRLPANPEVAQTILNFKHQGDELCRNDAYQLGLAKLQQATALLESAMLPSILPQQ